MEIDFSEINYLKDPTWQDLHGDYEQFLLSMTGPTVIDITGKNPGKCRVFTTLLHGHEPSGLIASHRYLTEVLVEGKPETNLRFIICSVEAAAIKPLFSHRYPEGGVDINRCFGITCDTESNGDESMHGYYQRASLIEKAIKEVKPEMVIDFHNTYSPSPTFTVCSAITRDTLSIASIFSQTLILSDLRNGSIIEQDFGCPFLTVECGAVYDEQAHEIAFSGITQIAQCENISQIQEEKLVDILYHPIRLQLNDQVNLSFAKHDEGYSGVTLKDNIECFNFGSAHQDEMLGWTDGNGLDNLKMIGKGNENVIEDYFYTRDNQLVCRHNIRIFKAKKNKHSAMNDCLFYVVKLASTDRK